MSTPVDERTAWDLVRAVTPGSVQGTSLVRLRPDSDPDVWLEVDSVGGWEASCAMSDDARDLLDLYLPVRIARAILIGQLGQSLDGRIATESGASHFVTGPKDIERLHRLRALMDAVIVGATTVVHDDPRLTVRLAEGPNPVRVVLDPSGQVDPTRRVFDGTATTHVVRRGDRTTAGGTGNVLFVPWSEPRGFDLADLLAQLRGQGLRRILVEGGGVTVSRFLQAGLLDRLHLTVAPLLIGSGRPSITLDAVTSLDQALRPRCRRFTLGEDVLFDLDLRSQPA
jgi:riboflavin-specific deaminase-like protein